MKAVLVGEQNPYGSDKRFALYPHPYGCAGHRLCNLVLGLDADTYLSRFERRNLLDYQWSAPAARNAASLLIGEFPGHQLILLGARVSAAFGLPYEPLTRQGEALDALILPHPSGRNRWWHATDAFTRARDAVEAFISEPR